MQLLLRLCKVSVPTTLSGDASVLQVFGEPLPVHIIAVETREPYRCGVWALTSHVLDEAEDRNDDAMDELARCRKTGVWPTRYEALREMDRL